MGLLNSLLEIASDIVATPIAIVKDAITIGGITTDEEAATPEALKKLVDDILK